MEIKKSNMYYHNIWADIHGFCIDNSLFTHGSNHEYNKMFNMAYDKHIPDIAIACIIYACSETDLTLDQIENKIANIRQILYLED